jgi:uncharacterized membrane protein
MDTKKVALISFGLIAFSFLFGLYNYPNFPDTFATHWGLNGEANGFSSKLEGISFLPIISVFVIALLLVVPRFDPMKKNYAAFRKYYDGTIIVMAGFFAYIQVLMVLWNLSYHFNLLQMMSVAFGVLFYYLGILLEHAKQNWFVGIRTPWTMSNAKVWDKTHKFGAKLFKAAGVIAFLGAFLFKEILLVSVVLVVAAAIASFVYSYLEFKKLK